MVYYFLSPSVRKRERERKKKWAFKMTLSGTIENNENNFSIEYLELH